MRFGLRILVLASIVALIIFSTSITALARTWTSRSGNTVSGRFVRMELDKVVLVRGGKVFKIPFERLCQKDQDYLRDKLSKGGKDKLLPVRKSKAGVKERTWTDVTGREISASFVRIVGNEVVLNKGGKDVKVAIDRLCAPDQAYARAANARTRESRVKEARRKQLEAEKKAREEEKEKEKDEDNAAAESELQRAMRAEEERKKRSSHNPTPSHAHVPHFPGSPAHIPPGTNRFSSPTPPQQPSTATPSSQPPVPNEFFGPRSRVLICTNCNNKIKSEVKAGDRCPKCDAYLNYVENEDGTKEYAGIWRNKGLWAGLFIIVMATIVRAFVRKS